VAAKRRKKAAKAAPKRRRRKAAKAAPKRRLHIYCQISGKFCHLVTRLSMKQVR